MLTVLSVFGTRPEAIKMAPVVLELERHRSVRSRVCVTAQHRGMLDQVLEVFGIEPDHDLDLMKEGQDLVHTTTGVLEGLRDVLHAEKPDVVLVHGDTTTTLAASLAAYYARIPSGHVEAGLRTHDKFLPYPEEINRRVAGVLCDYHFAPTETARRNLLREGVCAARVFVTGNTVIDALLTATEKIEGNPDLKNTIEEQYRFLESYRRVVLVTGHRRENFGAGLRNVCEALASLADRYPDTAVVYPVHLNPNVRDPVRRALGDGRRPNIHLLDPLPYLPFVHLMARSYLVITDSGGIQEEAPALGKPVLVTRETTERPEAVEAGTALLVGADAGAIVDAASRLLDDSGSYLAMSRAHNPYGDGTAAVRIVRNLLDVLA